MVFPLTSVTPEKKGRSRFYIRAFTTWNEKREISPKSIKSFYPNFSDNLRTPQNFWKRYLRDHYFRIQKFNQKTTDLQYQICFLYLNKPLNVFLSCSNEMSQWRCCLLFPGIIPCWSLLFQSQQWKPEPCVKSVQR